MTTKQQEREILAKIEKLIKSAGEDSYIGAAFTGCVDLARDNIENDFCQNFPDRLDRLEHDNGVLSKAVNNMNEEIKILRADKDQLDADVKAAIQKQIPADLYRDLWLMIEEEERRATENILAMSNTLAGLANSPNDIAVKHGLSALAKATGRRDRAADLLARLEKYE